MKLTNPTELIVVRHAQTVWNLADRHQGHLDSELSAVGIRQAEALARRLESVSFEALYSSDLTRASQTASYISQSTNHSITLDERLRERNYGIFRGLTVEEIRKHYPDQFGRLISGDPDYVVPEGESARQVFDRTLEAAREIVEANLERRIVIVTHGGVLEAFFRYTCGIALSVPRRFRILNASLNTFLVQGRVWILKTWGDIDHLQGIDTLEEGLQT